MPKGAISEDLQNKKRFRKYAAANIQKWYKYINGPLGREAENGDVRLVVGHDKATSWGMAALPNTSKRTRLKFKPLDGPASDSHIRGYDWDHSGVAEVRVGPSQEETDELRREDPDDSTTQNKYLNQCLVVRTLNPTLNEDGWEKLKHEIDVGCTPDSTTGNESPSHSPSNGNPSRPNTESTSSIIGNSGVQGNPGNSSALVQFTLLDGSANRMVISSPPSATVSRVFATGSVCFNSILS
jgi:hypothetical protein